MSILCHVCCPFSNSDAQLVFRHAIALSDITIRWEEKQTILSLTMMYHEDSVVWSVCV